MAVFDEAIALYEEIAESLKNGPPSVALRLPVMRNLADVYAKTGRLDEAIGLHEETLQLKIKKFGANHPSVIKSALSLISSYRDRGLFKKASELIESTDKNLPRKHPVSFAFKNNAGKFFMQRQSWPRALQFAEDAKLLSDRFYGPKHPHSVRSLKNWALCLHYAGDVDSAIAKLKELVELQSSVLGPNDSETCHARRRLARLYLSQHRFVDAKLCEKAITEGIADQNTAEERADSWQVIAELCLSDNRSDQAATAISKAAEFLRQDSESYRIANQLRLWGKLSMLEADLMKAEKNLVSAFETFESADVPIEYRYQMMSVARDLSELYEQLDKTDNIEMWKSKLEQLNRSK